MNHHDVIWSQPPSLLTPAARLIAAPRMAFQAPAILRFTNDSFMQDFMDALQTGPEQLEGFKVRRETWRGFTPAPTPPSPKTPSIVRQRLGILPRLTAGAPAVPAQPPPEAPPGTPLKLYQPVHQRHYLVASSLVCRTVGLPDRAVDPGRGERTGSVVRRLLPPTTGTVGPVQTWDEHAWVAGPNGNVWQKVGSDPTQVLESEERLPLFAVQFSERERRRRLFAGVVPVGRREAYLGAPRSSGGAGNGVTPRTARKILFRKEVVEPWKVLVRRAGEVQRSFTGPFVGDDRAPSATEKAARLKLEREQIQTVSWFVLLDFARFLSTYLKPVWRAVLSPSRRSDLPGPQQDLLDALEGISLGSTLRGRIRRATELDATGDAFYAADDAPTSLREALARYGSGVDRLNDQLERQLEGVDEAYDRYDANRRTLWPEFLFPLADPDLPGEAPLPPAAALGSMNAEEAGELLLDEDSAVNDPLERLDKLAVLVMRALTDDDSQPAAAPAIPAAAIRPADAFEGWFVIRCVFERPGCEPLETEVVSPPTEPFQMAGFFDPDAPARPIRIGLPIDTTPGGLRKFDKNTAFVISDTLCGQIRRMRGMTLGDLVMSVLPWPLHKDLPVGDGGPCKANGLSIGMICSISIPIITLCALLLLIIMVSLLDFIFRWSAWFVICFPVPGLKAKQQGSSA